MPLVTGIVDGLVDDLSGQKSGLTFTVTSSINTPSGDWDVLTRYNLGIGLDVSGGKYRVSVMAAQIYQALKEYI